jgi:hypothetical protein
VNGHHIFLQETRAKLPKTVVFKNQPPEEIDYYQVCHWVANPWNLFDTAGSGVGKAVAMQEVDNKPDEDGFI